MIIAIYAVGPNGEFGNKNGTLPWGSLKEELECYKNAIKAVSPKTIVIGAATWDTLPLTAKEFISKNCSQLLIAKTYEHLESNIQEFPNMMFIKDISCEAIEKFSIFGDVVILGGARILLSLYPIVDTAYISTIFKCDDVHWYGNESTIITCDTILDQRIIQHTKFNASKILLHSECRIKNTKGDIFSFIQEFVIYNEKLSKFD